MSYVLEGPAGMGNVFGLYRAGMLPAGKFAIVSDGEYANGGSGPSTDDGKAYASRERAEGVLASRVSPKEEVIQ